MLAPLDLLQKLDSLILPWGKKELASPPPLGEQNETALSVPLVARKSSLSRDMSELALAQHTDLGVLYPLIRIAFPCRRQLTTLPSLLSTVKSLTPPTPNPVASYYSIP